MSETAQTLIKAALRLNNVIATGETPTDDEMADGLEALKFMLRSWSSENIMIPYITQDTLTMSGADYHTIGDGGDCDTDWPYEIKGAVVDGDHNLRIVGEARFRRLKLSKLASDPAYLWYNPVYPLGRLYSYPTGGSSMVIDSLKPLTDPTGLTASVQFPVGYDAAIKFNLAVDLAPEFGRDPSAIVLRRAEQTKSVIETKNFASQINAVQLELVKIDAQYNIDEG